MTRKYLLAIALCVLVAGSGPFAQGQRNGIRRVARPHANRYIVAMAGQDDPEAVGLQLAAPRGGRVHHVFRNGFRGFAVQMTAVQAASLATDPRVAYVEEDGTVTAYDTQAAPINWGLDRLDQHTLPLDGTYRYTPYTTQVHAFVIDTGIRPTHVEFGGRADIAGDFVDDDNNPATPAGNDDADPTRPDGADCSGHGTHVAGIIGGELAGVAKQSLLHSFRVLGCDGSGSFSAVIAAIDAVIADGRRPAVINMSLGGDPSLALDDAVRRAVSAGITVVVAAGNSGVDASSTSPARVAEAITVGATDGNDARAGWSNYGAVLDVFAPGVSIVSSWPSSDTDYGALSGTSMASPHVAGVVALYLAKQGNTSPANVRTALISGAVSGTVVAPGAGSPNLLANSEFTLTSTPSLGATATFVRADTITQGNWKGAYGADGYAIVGDSASYPGHASVSMASAASWVWATASTDVRALQRAGNGRVAGTWYAGDSFTIDVAWSDAVVHQVALYALDWDTGGGRRERVDVLDAGSGATLDTRLMSGFQNGQYLVWAVSGHVVIRVTNSGGLNAVVSGLFFDGGAPPAPTPPAITSAPVSQTIAAGQSATLSVSASGTAPLAYQWYAGPSGDTRTPIAGATASTYTTPALTASASYWVRVSNTQGSADSATATVTVAASAAPQVSFLRSDATTQGSWKGTYGADGYAVVGDVVTYPSYATMAGTNAASWVWDGAPTDVRALQRTGSGRVAGTWYAPSAFTIDVAVSDGAVHQVALYCLDWDQNGRRERIDVVDPASGAVLDTRLMSGFQNGQYLAWAISGHVAIRVTNVAGVNAVVSGLFFDGGAPPAPTPPAITSNPASQTIAAGQSATLSVSANGTAPLAYQWYAGESGDTRAPIAGATASTYTTPALTASASYWARVSNAQGSADSATATVTVMASAAPQVSFLRSDATTQGTWKGPYGTDGYAVVGDVARYPPYATMAVTNAASWVWDSAPNDVRALQREGNGRVAGTWYATTSFTVDVVTNDEAAHQVALYLLDWDQNGRWERVDVIDPASGAVLDTRTIGGFQNGQYLVWTISGHVIFRITNVGGVNAVLSGFFFN
ncbi:MAG: S8 family serine peptidase [Acidobacteria bacterium]|nr:S8 family serine peptidase [Acidobacteriota bacterium]